MTGLPLNSPSVVCGEVVFCEKRDGADAYDLIVKYSAQRGRETVELIAPFYVGGSYNAPVCATLVKGDRVMVEFFLNGKAKQTGSGYWTNLDCRTVKRQSAPQEAPAQSSRPSDKLNYRKEEDDKDLPF